MDNELSFILNFSNLTLHTHGVILLLAIIIGLLHFLYIIYLKALAAEAEELAKKNNNLECILTNDLITRVLETYIKHAEIDPIKKSMFTKEEYDLIITLINKKN